MTPEEYYKKRDYPTLDKFDKKAPKFDYYDLVDFAEQYAEHYLKQHLEDNIPSDDETEKEFKKLNTDDIGFFIGLNYLKNKLLKEL